MKKVYLDMDGTIADLYKINNWLSRLLAEDKTIFMECQPMVTEEILFQIFPQTHYKIIVLSMTPKDATHEYCVNVEHQKIEWLNAHFPHLTNRVFMTYGHNKNIDDSWNCILVDDNAIIRENFLGKAINPIDLWG